MIELLAAAKLNLALEITGRRPDGYHLLDSVFVSVSLYDWISLEESEEIVLETSDTVPAGADNLAVKAAVLLQEKAAPGKGCRICLKKGIPSQAGMGGASADAAAVLLGLNRLWNLNLPYESLMETALSLGADVPFFLKGGCARAEGIGERLTHVPNPELYFAVAKGSEGLSTPSVYKAWDMDPEPASGVSSALLEAFAGKDTETAARCMKNTLERPASELCPGIKDTLKGLRSTSPIAAAMTGSGSACFGWYRSMEEAQRAADKMRKHGFFAEAVSSVPCAIRMV